MNFFKSVFSDDADPSGSESDNVPQNKSQDTPNADSSPSEHRSDPSGAGAGAWNFGGLLKTLSTKSESIIETYRRDLQEFGTGLKKEIEVAHGSLETVGHAIDQFGNTVVKGTAQIISHGKDAILELDSDNKKPPGAESSLNSIPYSRFDAQVRAIQGDVSTYTEVPEDLDEYNKWKSEFSLEGKSDEMEGFLKENEAMKSVYERLVPNTVERETFWFRYYYKVYKFKKAEDVRARLVRRMSWEEEDLSWDVEDDDDNGDEREGQGKINLGREGDSKTQDGRFQANREVGIKSLNEEEGSKVEKRDDSLQSEEHGNKRTEHVEESKVETKSEVVQEMGDGSKETVQEDGNRNGSEADSDKKVIVESKDDIGNGKSQVVAGSHDEEEDLEWDEIEDLSSIDEKKVAQSGSPSKKVHLKKRLNAAEEEDDLSWDIEDDDEPARA